VEEDLNWEVFLHCLMRAFVGGWNGFNAACLSGKMCVFFGVIL
jgi:hypothetical protein